MLQPSSVVQSGRKLVADERTPLIGLGVMLALGGALLLYLYRGIGYWGDDWNFILNRDGIGMHQLFDNHNGHLVVLPVLLYKLNAALFGIGSVTLLHICSVAMHLAIAGLLYVFVAKRIGRWQALPVALLMLALGNGWENIFWSFQIGFLVSMAAGLGALLVFESSSNRRVLYTSLLLLVSVSASGVGVMFLMSFLVRIIWKVERRAALRAAAVPVALFATWWLAFASGYRSGSAHISAPQFAVDMAAHAFGGLAGIGLDWGRSLAVVAVIGVLVAIGKANKLTSTQAALLVMPLAFWGLTALQRNGVAQAYPTRYIYVGALFLLLVAAEFAREIRFTTAGRYCVAAVFIFAVATNVDDLRAGERYMRDNTMTTRVELTALRLAGADVATKLNFDPADASFTAWHIPEYFRLVPAAEAPEYKADDIAGLPAARRQQVDDVLRRALPLQVLPGRPAEASGATPSITHAVAANAQPAGKCVEVTPAGSGGSVDFILPPASPKPAGITSFGGQINLAAPFSAQTVESATGVDVFLRRFGDDFSTEPSGRLPAGRTTIAAPYGHSTIAWTTRLASKKPFLICGDST